MKPDIEAGMLLLQTLCMASGIWHSVAHRVCLAHSGATSLAHPLHKTNTRVPDEARTVLLPSLQWRAVTGRKRESVGCVDVPSL